MELRCGQVREMIRDLGDHCCVHLPAERMRLALSVFDELAELVADQRQRVLAALPHAPVVAGRLDDGAWDARKAGDPT